MYEKNYSSCSRTISKDDTPAMIQHEAEAQTPDSQKIQLTLATKFLRPELKNLVSSFNKENEEYEIVIAQYPEDDEGLAMIKAEIASGNAPESIAGDVQNLTMD